MKRKKGRRLLLLLMLIAGIAGIWTWIQAGEEKESFLGGLDRAFFKLDARAAVLVDAETGDVLYEQDGDTPYPVASMSKMMTEYILLEAIRINGSHGKTAWRYRKMRQQQKEPE